MTLPTDPAARKAVPLFSGCLAYFPDALAEVAACSKAGNDQHQPGEPLHWARAKSADEADALARHLLEHGTIDTDGIRHSAKLAWRALALLQKELEAAGAPLARGARPADPGCAVALNVNPAALRDDAIAHGIAWDRPSLEARMPSDADIRARHTIEICPHCACITGTRSD